MRKKILSAVLSVAMVGSMLGAFTIPAGAATAKEPQYQDPSRKRVVEDIDRGLIAVYTGSGNTANGISKGVYLSWRLLGNESLTNQAFDIYRATSATGSFGKIHTTGEHDATNWTDTNGAAAYRYIVVKSGESIDGETAVTPMTNVNYADSSVINNGYSEKNAFTYIDIPIDRPDPVARMGDGKLSYYYNDDNGHEGGANDASIGDIDGDGQYEIILKWDPQDSKDSAGADYTGNCYIDAYEIDPNNGGRKWRIDLGPNVTSGAHYTQFIVYDFDNDGKAEIAMKTGPGSKDALGNYVTAVGDTEEIRNYDNTKSYIGDGSVSGGKGKNIYGKEFLTVFEGETGRALATTEYIPLISSGTWGDSKYNRAERFLAGVAYLNGETPSIIMCRGYYERAVIRAYDWDGESLTMRWEHIGTTSKTSMFHSGNHQLSISDVDDDGKDEIVYGSAVLDDNGKMLANSNKGYGHGDALHVNDFNNDGVQEAFSVKEHKEGYANNAANFRNLKTGDDIWGHGASGDTGRGVMANIDDAYAKGHSNALALAWSSSHTNVFDLAGNEINAKPKTSSRGMDNFLIYWDGDLGRELLDDNQLAKYYAETGYTVRFYDGKNGYISGTSNNFTKHTPSLSADLWGDWREEIILPYNKSNSGQAYLRIFTSILPTNYRLTTLMHDTQYRQAIAWQNVGYNQPPHTSYYIGSAALATDADGNELNYLAPAFKYENVEFWHNLPQTLVTGINLSDTSITLERARTYSLSASVIPSDAKKKGITWTSSDPSVATVNNGVVTAVGGSGTATITATTKEGGFSKSCEVTVWSKPVTGITVPGELVEISTGQIKSLTATVEPADASEPTVEWRSTNPSVATVDDEGSVTGVSMGLATIYAKTVDGDFEDACVVNVVPVTSVNKTGSGVFETDNTDTESKLSNSTATGASFAQDNAKVAGNFYKTFDAVDSDKKATLSFRFTTGGTKVDGTNWNWDGHEFSFYVKLLDKDGANILTLSQPFETKAGALMSKTGANAEAGFTSEWRAVVDNLGTVQGSAKRWQVDIEFDYDNRTADAVLRGYGNGFASAATAQYETSFELPADDDGNSIVLNKLEVSSSVDGAGGIYWHPIVEAVSYEEIVPVKGSSSVLYRRGEKHSIPWSETDLSPASDGWTQTGTTTAQLMYDSENQRIWYNPKKPGASYSAAKTFDVSDNGEVAYDIDWYFGSSMGRINIFDYLQIGSDIRLGWTNGYLMFLSTDGGATYDGITDGTADKTKAIFTGSNTTFVKNVKANIDTKNRIIKSLTFDGTEILSDYNLPEGATYNSVTFGLVRADSSASDWNYPNGIQNIAVSQFVEGVDPTYNVKFVDIDGTVLESKNVTVGTNAEYTGAAVTREADERYDSYVFKGWKPDPATVKILDDTVFTADYTYGNPRAYTVAFESNGGELVTDITGYTYGDEKTLPTPEKAGNTFAGWYENESLEGKAVTAITSTTYGNKTYYAKWEPIKYTVMLNVNGGTVVGDPITEYTYGTAVTLPTNYTKNGHDFEGWYENENLTGNKVTEISATDTGNKTYYAKWEPATYNVTLNLFGGAVATPITSYTYGNAVTLPTPTKAGYTFDGWYSNSTYRTKSSAISAAAMGDKTFYAKWTTSAPTIEFGSVGEDGKKATVYFSADKNTDIIIGVLYDNGAVKEIKTSDTSATNFAANTVYSKDIVFENNVNDYDLKLFLWDSISGAKPLAVVPGTHNKAQ